MANLGPQRINQSFGDLLQLPNGLTSSLQAVQDGSGNVTPLQISNTDVQTTFIQAGTGAVMRTMQNKARESVSVLDFDADPTGTTDSTDAFQNAINASTTVVVPIGIYKISQTLTNTDNLNLIGEAGTSTAGNAPQNDYSGSIILWTGATNGIVVDVDPANATAISITGIKFFVDKTFTGKVLNIRAGLVTNEPPRAIVELDKLGFYRTPLDYSASYAPGNSTSIAVYFDVTNSTSNKYACIGHRITNIYAFNFGTLFKVEVTDAAVGGVNFFNSNYFANVYCYQVYRLLYMISGTAGRGEITANTFVSFQCQPGLDSSGIAAAGVIRFENKIIANTFYGVKIWDVPDNKKLSVNNPVGSDANGYYTNRFYSANIPPSAACIIDDDLRSLESYPQYKIWQINAVNKLRLDEDGLKFNGDTAAANALNDYEEGTFTPTLNFNNTNTGMTFSSQSGIYTKIGRMVFFTLEIVLTNKGSSTGNATISGLPFASGSGTQFAATPSEFYDLAFAAVYPIYSRIAPLNTVIVLRKQVAPTYVQAMTDADFTNITTFRMSGSYSV